MIDAVTVCATNRLVKSILKECPQVIARDQVQSFFVGSHTIWNSSQDVNAGTKKQIYESTKHNHMLTLSHLNVLGKRRHFLRLDSGISGGLDRRTGGV